MGKGDRKGGRPRKSGPREPSGRISRRKSSTMDRIEEATFAEMPHQHALQRRARALGHVVTGPITRAQAEQWELQGCGDILGEMRLRGQITREQEQAGRSYAQAWERYRVLCGLPAGTPSGPSYGAVRGGGPDPDPETARQARDRYAAMVAILDAGGAAMRRAVDRVALRDRPATVNLVSLGLAALAEKNWR
jgi:hypothetical protein